jgi:hypothetical protein
LIEACSIFRLNRIPRMVQERQRRRRNILQRYEGNNIPLERMN